MIEKTEIPLSKIKIGLLTIASLIFVFLGYFMFIKTGSYFGILGMLFFSGTGVFGFYKIFGNSKGLIIDKNGISDYSNTSSVGLIKWNDIIEINTIVVSNQKFIIIYVKNPEEYIENSKNKLQKRFLKMNYKMYGSPFYITANSLKYNFKKLKKILQSEFNKHKQL